jgi:hypothetical protein
MSSGQMSARELLQRLTREIAIEDGKPVELGRGAMGVTYKELDVDLRCPTFITNFVDPAINRVVTQTPPKQPSYMRTSFSSFAQFLPS